MDKTSLNKKILDTITKLQQIKSDLINQIEQIDKNIEMYKNNI